jgi:hypothetical protein
VGTENSRVAFSECALSQLARVWRLVSQLSQMVYSFKVTLDPESPTSRMSPRSLRGSSSNQLPTAFQGLLVSARLDTACHV